MKGLSPRYWKCYWEDSPFTGPILKSRMMLNPLGFIPSDKFNRHSQTSPETTGTNQSVSISWGPGFVEVFFFLDIDNNYISSCTLNNGVVRGISCLEIVWWSLFMWWAWLHSNASGQATHDCPVLSEFRHHGNLQWDLCGSKLRQSLENSFLEFKGLSSFKAPFGHWNKHSGPHLKCFAQGRLRRVQWSLEMSPDLCLTLAIDPSIFIP